MINCVGTQTRTFRLGRDTALREALLCAFARCRAAKANWLFASEEIDELYLHCGRFADPHNEGTTDDENAIEVS